MFSKNSNLFAPENMKKRPQTLLIIGPKLFFSNGPAAQMALKQKFVQPKAH